jgi:hypothetical protein
MHHVPSDRFLVWTQPCITVLEQVVGSIFLETSLEQVCKLRLGASTCNE